jgi:hypothetical protein
MIESIDILRTRRHGDLRQPRRNGASFVTTKKGG